MQGGRPPWPAPTRTHRRVPWPFRGAVSHRGHQLCKKRGIFISSEIHFPVSRLRGCEQINWEAAGRAGGGWKCRSLSEGKTPVPLMARAGSSGDGWDGAVARLLVGHGTPQPQGAEGGHPSAAGQGGAGRDAEEKAAQGLAPRGGRKPGGPGVPGAGTGASPAPRASSSVLGQPYALN